MDSKFTEEDVLLKLDSKIESRPRSEFHLKTLLNEDFEHHAITDKSALSAQQLRIKYKHIYFL